MDKKTLALLVELAQKAKDNLLRTQMEYQQRYQKANTTLNRLSTYANEYKVQAFNRRLQGMDIASDHNQLAFDQRLEDAVQSQRNDMQKLENEIIKVKEQVALIDQKLKSFDILRLRDEARAQAKLNKQEQLLNDEFARRAFHSRANETE